MRAFILRRVELIARGFGDVVLLGSIHCSGTLRVKEFLTRNGHPYSYIDLDRDNGVQDLLDSFPGLAGGCSDPHLPGQSRSSRPEQRGDRRVSWVHEAIDQTHVRDTVIVGAGPSGLAAASTAPLKDLTFSCLSRSRQEARLVPAQRLKTISAFSLGVSGQELASRAYAQAQKFGAELIVAKGARQLACDRKPYAIEVDDGVRLPGRTIIIATGAEYRRLELENLSQFEGAGVYYGATFIESQLCNGEEVVVVGGGNSAGQAAVFLSQTASRVHLLVRSDDLEQKMSRYLIRRIEGNSAIELRTQTEIVGLEGSNHLERVRWRDNLSGKVETRVSATFLSWPEQRQILTGSMDA
jgi:thioredoxin reductase (NADPH)